MENTLSFTGSMSGDGSCFYWQLNSPEEAKRILGERYKEDFDLELELAKEMSEFRDIKMSETELIKDVEARLKALYPNQVLDLLNCQSGKNYKFTISVEEIK